MKSVKGRVMIVVLGVGVSGGAVGLTAWAQSDPPVIGLPDSSANGKNQIDGRSAFELAEVAAKLAPSARWKQMVFCTLNRPSEVQRYSVQCQNASRLDANVADCCIPGDHWEAKSKSWDVAPNTAVTTSPGPANAYGVLSRVYNYGGTPQNPGNLSAEVDCAYAHGVNVFPAASFIVLSSDGPCTVTDLGRRDEINRTP